MEIKSGQPIAGQRFDFTIEGQRRGDRTKTVVVIDGKEVFAHDCDDPPCHEMFVIPPNARGKEMFIHAKSKLGEEVEAYVRILDDDTDTDAGMMVGG